MIELSIAILNQTKNYVMLEMRRVSLLNSKKKNQFTEQMDLNRLREENPQ